MYAMANPIKTLVGAGFLDNAFMGGTSPNIVTEGIGFTLNYFGITKGIK